MTNQTQPTVYYAHDKRTYKTDEEKENLATIRRLLVAKVINPRTEVNQNKPGPAIMDECLKIVAEVDIFVFSAFEDREIRKGVRKELAKAVELNKPVFWLVGGELLPMSEFEIYYSGNLENWDIPDTWGVKRVGDI